MVGIGKNSNKIIPPPFVSLMLWVIVSSVRLYLDLGRLKQICVGMIVFCLIVWYTNPATAWLSTFER